MNEKPPKRKGISRVFHAIGYSLAGLHAGWREPAFRQEVVAATVLLPSAFWVGRSWVEIALLCASVVLVMVVELLNTAVEAAIDRMGSEWHELSKRAKDTGSAAVFLSMLLCGSIWGAALYQRLL